MNDHSQNKNGNALPGWEDDGGALRADRTVERRQSEQRQLDTSHESDVRGDHRYDGAHQTAAEQRARHERDEFKRRLRGREPGRR